MLAADYDTREIAHLAHWYRRYEWWPSTGVHFLGCSFTTGTSIAPALYTYKRGRRDIFAEFLMSLPKIACLCVQVPRARYLLNPSYIRPDSRRTSLVFHMISHVLSDAERGAESAKTWSLTAKQALHQWHHKYSSLKRSWHSRTPPPLSLSERYKAWWFTPLYIHRAELFKRPTDAR